MRNAKISSSKDGRMIADPCWVTETFFERAKGLLGRTQLESGSGMLIVPCSSIHTFFMKFPIDVAYLDDRFRVLRVSRNVNPWKMHFPVFGAHAVLELAAGGASGIVEGDELCLS